MTRPPPQGLTPERGGARLVGGLVMSNALGTLLGDTRIRLLEAIAEHGSITQAAKRVPLSYKAAWDAVDAMNNLADRPLVECSTGGKHGGGTVLTEEGRKLVCLFRALEAECQVALDRLMSQWDELQAVNVHEVQQLLRRLGMRTSARNQFVCRVRAVSEDVVDCEVALSVDGRHELVARITHDSARQLGLSLGQDVVAMFKACAVDLVADDGQGLVASNRLAGVIERITSSSRNSEVVLAIGGGKTLTTVVSNAVLRDAQLKQGSAAVALLQASSIILSVLG